MSSTLSFIKRPIEAELKIFEKKFRDSMKSDVPLLDNITRYIIKRKGKQMRPILVFLSARLCSETVNDSTYRGASLIELLHTATLVHDDVVDDAYYRRSFFSINALWKNKAAVLVGDYLLSQGLLLATDNEDFSLLKIVSNAVREMSEGELLQMEKSRLLNITEEDYFKIIRQKTATLISACCEVGACSVNAPKELQTKMAQFGEKIGLAFQIKDDLFDYTDNSKIGKPVGIDIKEKKLTLPLIYSLNKAQKSERKKVIHTIKNESHKKSNVQWVIDFVKESGGDNYAIQKIQELLSEAKNLLNGIKQNEIQPSLMSLVDFIATRNK